jgi:hypothetical protein
MRSERRTADGSTSHKPYDAYDPDIPHFGRPIKFDFAPTPGGWSLAPRVDKKPTLELNGLLGNLGHEGSDASMDGSDYGFVTPPIGSITPGGMYGVLRSPPRANSGYYPFPSGHPYASTPGGDYLHAAAGPPGKDISLLHNARSASDFFRKSELERNSRKRTIIVGDSDRLVKRTTTTTYHSQARSTPRGFPGLKSEATMRERLLEEAQRISGLPIPTGISASGKRSRGEDDGG